jgi:hypothetical protein
MTSGGYVCIVLYNIHIKERRPRSSHHLHTISNRKQKSCFIIRVPLPLRCSPSPTTPHPHPPSLSPARPSSGSWPLLAGVRGRSPRHAKGRASTSVCARKGAHLALPGVNLLRNFLFIEVSILPPVGFLLLLVLLLTGFLPLRPFRCAPGVVRRLHKPVLPDLKIARNTTGFKVQ